MEKFADHIASLKSAQGQIDSMGFDDFKREHPDLGSEDFRQYKENCREKIEDQIDEEIQIVQTHGLGRWEKYHKKNRARCSDAGASTSGS
jgi:hypothetical protein